VDIPQDQGGYVGVQYDASLFDGQHPAYEITHYSFWRAMDLAKSAAPKSASFYPTKSYFQTSSQQYWEHMGDMNAQQFPNYAYTAPTYADSVAENSFDIDFLVIAHTPDSDIFFTSLPAAGHSVDNIAPPAPADLSAYATLDGIFLHWPQSKANDVDRYTLFRSLDQSFPAVYTEQVATTTDSLFLDESVGEMVDYFYIVIAEDIHGNLSIPSRVATGMAPVPVYLSGLTVRLDGGKPFLTWSILASEAPMFKVTRIDPAGRRNELDASNIESTDEGFTFTDGTAEPGVSYSYSLSTFTNGRWQELGTSDSVATPKLEFALGKASPNPFNPSTTITFSITRPGQISVDIYDLMGRRVRTLHSGFMDAGERELVWNGISDTGSPVSSGTYFVSLRSEEGEKTQKIMLVK